MFMRWRISMKRNLVYFSFLVALGLLGAASSAFAVGGVVFSNQPASIPVRQEGLKEATGNVVLIAQSTGTVCGSTAGCGTGANAGTVISITYSTNLAVAVTSSNLSCTGTPCTPG